MNKRPRVDELVDYNKKTAVSGQKYWHNKHQCVVLAETPGNPCGNWIRRVCAKCGARTNSLKTEFCPSPFCQPLGVPKYVRASAASNYIKIVEDLGTTSWSLIGINSVDEWKKRKIHAASILDVSCVECQSTGRLNLHDFTFKGSLPRCECVGGLWKTANRYKQLTSILEGSNLALSCSIEEWMSSELKFHSKVKFVCSMCGHESESEISNIVSGGHGINCLCRNKMERQLFNFVSSNLPNEWSCKFQYIVESLVSDKGRCMPFDIVVVRPDDTPCLFVELDGLHHFGDCFYCSGDRRIAGMKRDLKKQQYIKSIESSLVRIEANTYNSSRHKVECQLLNILKSVEEFPSTVTYISNGPHYTTGLFAELREYGHVSGSSV